MAKGRRTGPPSDEWYNERDHLKAWDRLIGRRVAALRLQRKADSARTYTGPRRGLWLGRPENFSQGTLSTRLGRTQSWCSKIERGERSLTVGDAYLLASLLDVDPSVLVGPPTAEEQTWLDSHLGDLRDRWQKERRDLGRTS